MNWNWLIDNIWTLWLYLLSREVASPAFSVRSDTKLSENLRVTQKYYEIHAIDSDKAIGLCIFSLDRQPHESEFD